MHATYHIWMMLPSLKFTISDSEAVASVSRTLFVTKTEQAGTEHTGLNRGWRNPILPRSQQAHSSVPYDTETIRQTLSKKGYFAVAIQVCVEHGLAG